MKGTPKDRSPQNPGTLILTRKVGERIFIGSDVAVQLIDIRGGQAKIGVSAPRDVAINREELMERFRQPTGGGKDGG